MMITNSSISTINSSAPLDPLKVAKIMQGIKEGIASETIRRLLTAPHRDPDGPAAPMRQPVTRAESAARARRLQDNKALVSALRFT